MTRQEIIEKIKSVLAECFPEQDFSDLREDSVINTDESIDSMGFVLVICKLEAFFDIRIPQRQWQKMLTLGDVANTIEKYLAKK
jgi:acyl carrier protein